MQDEELGRSFGKVLVENPRSEWPWWNVCSDLGF